MKNIHILSTDKLSKFYFNHNDNCFQLCKVEKKSTPLKVNQNIYITSDEEIKKEDWCFLEKDGRTFIYKCTEKPQKPKNWGLKIILTTDQDLIKNGVQAIDDEFLEWIVKNLSCEFIKTEKWLDDEGKVIYSREIPKEEPKQECNCDNTCSKCEEKEKQYILQEVKEKAKQETLEEVAENELRKQNWDTTITLPFNGGYIEGFQQGAKWQAERMYSEKDMRQMYEYGNLGYFNENEALVEFKKR